MEEENIIDDLISENRNEFDEISSRSNFIFEELSNKVLCESSTANSLNQLKQTETTRNINETQSDSNTDFPNEIQASENIQQENDENVCLTSGSVLLTKATRPCQFAVSRIKTIMKLDPELALASKESTYLICKATELFVDFIATEAYKFTSQGSRKTLQKKDIGLFSLFIHDYPLLSVYPNYFRCINSSSDYVYNLNFHIFYQMFEIDNDDNT